MYQVKNPDSRILAGRKWYDADRDAWLAAAMRAKADGFVQKPNRWREATFHRNGEVFALVRDLGKLNWHLVPIKGEHYF